MTVKTRRLADLYVTGREVIFDDGALDENDKPLPPITVWLQKISPIDHERNMRSANAKRASVLALLKDTKSDYRQSLIGDMYAMDVETLVQELASADIIKRHSVIEAEVAGEKDSEWAKGDYLQGLKDAWADGLFQRYALDPEDEEAKHVFEEFDRFDKIVERRLDDEREELVLNYRRYDEDTLREKWVEKRVAMEADQEWLHEFRRGEVFYGTRDVENHRKYYFKDRAEYDECPIEVISILMAQYQVMSLDPIEGKDSRLTQDSSTPSESAENPETVPPSGPETSTD